jgi:phosphoglycolate phosphatase-like HAD superfamily hydrolase
VFGIEDAFNKIDMMGRTDPSILREALDSYNLDWDIKNVNKFKEIYLHLLVDELEVPRSGKRICPGVLPLLNSLKNYSNIILGLLTGNWRHGAFLKLRHFKLDNYFALGAFADDSSERKDLVPVVLERGEKNMGLKVEKHNVYVIGDTPLDVLAAKPHNVQTIGVATGFHSLKDLAISEPDYLFKDFQITQDFLKVVVD